MTSSEEGICIWHKQQLVFPQKIPNFEICIWPECPGSPADCKKKSRKWKTKQDFKYALRCRLLHICLWPLTCCLSLRDFWGFSSDSGSREFDIARVISWNKHQTIRITCSSISKNFFSVLIVKRNDVLLLMQPWLPHLEHSHSLVFSVNSRNNTTYFYGFVYYNARNIINNNNSTHTWIIIVFDLADKVFPVGDKVSACWRSTWFSDSELESFSSNLNHNKYITFKSILRFYPKRIPCKQERERLKACIHEHIQTHIWRLETQENGKSN